MVEELSIKPAMKELGKLFKREAKAVAEALEAMSECDALEMKAKLDAGQAAQVKAEGQTFEIQPGHVEIKKETVRKTGRNFTPGVIEPSFGIGRILYCVFEHCFYTREGDDKRTVFAFPAASAPIKCTVFPLLQRAELSSRAESMSEALTRVGLSNTIDVTGTSIGRRYARTDEVGVPFAITIDYQTVEDGTATLRERDSMAQVRVPTAELAGVVRQLVDSELSWAAVAAKYPAQAPAAEED